jgi:hypothetical protein
MQTRYRKTAAGQAEVRAKSLSLSRPVRNLLLSINASQPAAFWLSQLQGVNPADLNMLKDAGLIEAIDAQAVAATAPEAARTAAPAFEATIPVERELSPDPRAGQSASAAPATNDALWLELQADVKRSSYESLSEVLNAQAKAQLGLVRGYRFTLEMERCDGVAEMQTFAAKFAERLREEYGMTAVRRFHAALRARL